MAMTFPTIAGKSQTAPTASFSATPTTKYIAAPDETSTTNRFADLLRASQVTDSSSTAGVTSAEADLATSNDETKDQFMALLVAQMRNQDPLNPLDNAQVTTQLAQINTVRGIDELNKKLVTLTDKFDSGDPSESASMIGRQVLVAGDRFRIEAGEDAALHGGAEFATPATASQVEIFNASSQVVRTIGLGAQPAGMTTFEWDGRNDAGTALAAGEYGFRVLAQGTDGTSMASPFTTAKVTGITRADEGTTLRLEEGATVPSKSIRGIF